MGYNELADAMQCRGAACLRLLDVSQPQPASPSQPPYPTQAMIAIHPSKPFPFRSRSPSITPVRHLPARCCMRAMTGPAASRLHPEPAAIAAEWNLGAQSCLACQSCLARVTVVTDIGCSSTALTRHTAGCSMPACHCRRFMFYECACVHTRACVCAHTRACVRACAHACVCVCAHACVRAHTHACVRAWMRACVRVCAHACVRAHTHACVRACVRAACAVRTRVHTCVRACVAYH